MTETGDIPTGGRGSLAEAQQWLRNRVEDGERCPCCTQLAKVYRRKLTSSIAAVLIQMWRQGGTDWVYLPGIRSRGQDEAIARYWNLIEKYPNAVRLDGSSRVGWWRLTPLGEDFVHRRERIPKYARIYDNRLLSLDYSALVSIVDVLGTKFNYQELMGGV